MKASNRFLTTVFRSKRIITILPWICGILWSSTGMVQAQNITIQGHVTLSASGMNIPLPMQTVVITLGGSTILTAMTDSSGFYSLSVVFPPLSTNGTILVSTNCPNGGTISNAQTLRPSVTVYNLPLTCGAGGGGSTTTILVNGALIWGSAPAPAGQLVQFYLGGSLSPVDSTTTGPNGIISDTLNINLGSATSGILIAVAPCGNGSSVRDTAIVSATTPVALFQLMCSSIPITTITVQGVVTSNSGMPMVNIPVRILMANTTTLTAFTDSSGFYSATFSVASALSGTIIVVSAMCGGPIGPGTPATGTATYIQGTSTYLVNLTCGGSSSRLLTVSGLYLDPSGIGIAGQPIQLFHNQYNTPLRTLFTTTGGFFSDTLTTSMSSGFVYVQSTCGMVSVPVRDTAFYTASSTLVTIRLQCSPPAGQHRVTGMVTGYTSANPMSIDTLSLVVIRIIPGGQGQAGGWATVDTVYLLDSAGSAYFSLMLPSGRYSLLATLLSGNASQYAPTYYGDTTTWTQADSFDLTGNATSYIIIDLCANQGGSGGGTVSGGVAGNLPRLSGPLPGIQVQLINANGMTPISHRRSVLTGSNGLFTLNDVPLGSYLLRCEHPGMHSVMVPVALSSSSPTHSFTSFNAGSNGFSLSSSSVQEIGFANGLIYPNPVQAGGQLTLLFNQTSGTPPGMGFSVSEPGTTDLEEEGAGNYILHIRDIRGQTCLRQEIKQFVIGTELETTHKISFELADSSIPAGIYTVELQGPMGRTKVFRLVVEP